MDIRLDSCIPVNLDPVNQLFLLHTDKYYYEIGRPKRLQVQDIGNTDS